MALTATKLEPTYAERTVPTLLFPRESADRETQKYTAYPFLKWAGGKGKLLEQLSKFFPRQFGNYFEPFAGSSAVFFYLRRTKGEFAATLMDANKELINCFSEIRDHVQGVIPLLNKHRELHGSRYYYEVRQSYSSERQTKLKRAAQFIYLNKTCYNGLYRVNKSGQFNVPVGSYKDPKIYDQENLKAAARALSGVTLMAGDFAEVVRLAKKNDFIYFDPPYFTDSNGFTGYAVSASGKADFAEEEHDRLMRTVKKLSDRGCHVVVSNSDTDFVRTIYKGFRIEKIKARRFINCDGRGRTVIDEVVISSR